MENLYLVCFLDILGYSELVEQKYTSENEIQKIEKKFKDVLKIIDGIVKREPDNLFIKANQIIQKEMKIRIMSDSVLITINLSNPQFTEDIMKEYSVEEGESGEKIEIVFILKTLWTISWIILIISAEIRYFFRGGITIGQYYEAKLREENNDSIFIFSKAFLDAVKLEKSAEFPRIIIGENLYDYVLKFNNEKPPDSLSEYFYIDGDDKRCLNPYVSLFDSGSRERNERITKKILGKIKDAIELQYKNNKDENITKKYKYIIDKYNFQVETKFNLPEFKISI